MNLVINASHAIGEHDGDIHLLARSDSGEPSMVTVEVRDTGAGMDEAVAARAFDPFFTTKEHGQGTGLGLAIVQDIVSNHGGTISLESQVGRGTVVRIRLPAAEGTEVAESEPHSSKAT